MRRCLAIAPRPPGPAGAKRAFTSVLESASLAAEANGDTSAGAACFRPLQTLPATRGGGYRATRGFTQVCGGLLSSSPETWPSASS